MKIVYFGTPQFAATVLAVPIAAWHRNLSCYDQARSAARPFLGISAHPVKLVAEAQHPPLPVYQPEIVSALDFAPILEAYQADLFVVVAYGEIIKQHLLDMPKVACINLYASLLPRYRRAAPIQRCIISGETESGVTVMHMVKKMDAGDMISTAKVAIGPDMTYGELEEALCSTGCELLLKTIHDFEKGIPARTPQNHELATLAPKIELEDTQINWNQPAKDIHNLICGVTPHPGAWCFVNTKGQKKRLRVMNTRLVEAAGESGTIVYSDKNGIVVACGEGAIRLVQIQLEGKKPMSADEFMRGHPPGTLLFNIA